MNFHSAIIQRALLQCEVILRGDSDGRVAEKIKQTDAWLIEQTKPKNFDPEDQNNDVNNLVQSFEFLCATLEDFGVSEPHKLTVRKFYSAVRYYKKKHSKQGRPTQSI